MRHAHKFKLFMMSLLTPCLSGWGVVAYGQSQPLSQPIVSQPIVSQPIISEQPDNVALTIYRDNLAFITETRTVNVPKGRSTISFAGVSDLMIPQTALLREFGALTLERNFDYDLLGQASLLEKSIGKIVYIQRTNPGTGEASEQEAVIISASARGGVVMEVDGRYETFDCSGLPEKISFSSLPDGLKAQPTLSIDVVSDKAGPQTLTISYLASGFDWQADYVLRLKGDGKADLAGWLTVTNETAISIKDAPTAIIAGNLQRLDETEAEEVYQDYFSAACWPKGTTKTVIKYRESRFSAAPLRPESISFYEEDELVIATRSRRESSFLSSRAQAEREDIGDYKLYRAPNPTTVAAYQTKQLLFLDKQDVEVKQYFVFDLDLSDQSSNQSDAFDGQGMPAIIRYDIDNKRDGALGEPLPLGTVRVMKKDAQGYYLFLGEDNVRDLAVDLPVEVSAANSNSVRVEVKKLAATGEKLEQYRRRYEADFEYRITNANDYAVLVEVTKNRNGAYSPIKIIRSSVKQEESAYPKWRVKVEPQSEMILNATLQWVE